MWLVIGEETDPGANRALAGLAARGLDPIELVTTSQLIASDLFEHRIGKAGAYSRFALPDGRVVDTREIRGVLNRASSMPWADIMPGADEHDRAYAIHEWNALLLSTLNAFDGTILNPPSPVGLAGAFRGMIEWNHLALRAGLAVAPFRATASTQDQDLARGTGSDPAVRRMFVVGNTLIESHAAPSLEEPCIRLSKLCATPLLQIDLLPPSHGAWHFAGASPVPDIEAGGDLLLDAIAEMLLTEGRSK